METSTPCNPKISPIWAIVVIASLFGFAWLMSGAQPLARKILWLLALFGFAGLGIKTLSLLAAFIIRPFLRR
ncbi:hypothetical protein Pcar_3391 [Syntrophotalea carbinolica DSM 2380]|uniref:Uncharacterized protein n=1 Tax=Syntrophotalea carbinolica (strain DSM 2380 / NBRC 103641 / GraBd1) TaxID=338963 RepID=Q0C6D2_SYNC1|nr:hypothetical protein Pcar_3391 [Syntrophotalea carbinolica DSM 2380]